VVLPFKKSISGYIKMFTLHQGQVLSLFIFSTHLLLCNSLRYRSLFNTNIIYNIPNSSALKQSMLTILTFCFNFSNDYLIY
jgi:hypothetical protein